MRPMTDSPALTSSTKEDEQHMPNTTSAKKAVRKTARRTAVNKARRSRMRTMVRKVEEAIASGQKEAALQALAVAEPILARTAQKGVIHKNTASRKVSRLVARIRAMPD
jgi:small subunit ribosomal protein S20